MNITTLKLSLFPYPISSLCLYLPLYHPYPMSSELKPMYQITSLTLQLSPFFSIEIYMVQTFTLFS
jgi:hypothetical protein